MGISLLYYFKYPFVEIMFFGRPLGGFGKTDTFGQGVGGGQKIEKNADVLFECPHRGRSPDDKTTRVGARKPLPEKFVPNFL